MPDASGKTGFVRDVANGRLSIFFNGTEVYRFTATAADPQVAQAVTGALSASTTVTGGTGLIATTGNCTVSAGDYRGTGNVRLGVVSAFTTTEPVSAVVMKAGTEPAGAIATSGGVHSSATVVRKIIADGTVSNVEA